MKLVLVKLRTNNEEENSKREDDYRDKCTREREREIETWNLNTTRKQDTLRDLGEREKLRFATERDVGRLVVARLSKLLESI